MNETQTIAAISTPPGEGGIGIIRISGPEALTVGAQILRHPSGKPIKTWPERKVRIGFVVDENGEPVDEVIFFYFKEQRSYTGEDVLEIQGHGGYQNLEKILKVVFHAGAQPAEPGEFTKRAFLNGRLDLTQAEAVIDLIRARTDLAQKVALQQLRGRLAQVIKEQEEKLLALLVPIEAALDFPEDEIPELQRTQALIEVRKIRRQLEQLLAHAERGIILRDAATVVIAGRPNVGKSSLLNQLLGEERAIVTPIPGTTRDFVSEIIDLDGVPVRLIDTAGVRRSDDPVEKVGVEKARQLMDEADLVLAIFDAATPLTPEDQELIQFLNAKPALIILNKTDLPVKVPVESLQDLFPQAQFLSISALTGTGIKELKTLVRTELIGSEGLEEQPVLVTRVRHKEAIAEAIDLLTLTAQGLEEEWSEDLLAANLRAALEALGLISGRSVSEEIINEIFTQFCIGK
ncbi:MAG TPA: tRNA uridine-5-carboxymethylaminomethyl(34) synthesis GTPase MnmE [Hydrogenispora sp.]|jgi:tRNA modification GTPase|nr:tRNA uridine-5-carboxymethylaminomethyl(34) synthesis GTPase MnmE [Hydrogenispora sp.]